MTDTEKKKRLKRMSEIVKQVGWNNADVSLIQELIHLANDPEFTGMDKRRTRLESCLNLLQSLVQTAAKERCWSAIYSTVSDFTSEIGQYGEGNSSGGIGHQ